MAQYNTQLMHTVYAILVTRSSTSILHST